MPAPEFKVNTTRRDPYKSFNFRVKWGAAPGSLVYVAGISKVSGLTRTTQVITPRSRGGPSTPRRSPSQSDYGPITLERGVTHDMNFEEWANKVWSYANSTQGNFPAPGKAVSLEDFRKEVVSEMYNEAGQLAVAYNIHRCWVSEYAATPEPDSAGNATLIQLIRLENEGWERDASVPEPQGPSFDFPAPTP